MLNLNEKPHLVVIPGFGMNAQNIKAIPGFFKARILVPNWGAHTFQQIVDDLADQINKIDCDLSNRQPKPRLIIYAFSVGADLLMEISNNHRLTIRPSSLMLLADPNINEETCVVTDTAARSNTFADFCREVKNIVLSGGSSPKNTRDWLYYVDWLAANNVDAHWSNLQEIAKVIVQGAPKRFRSFFDSIQFSRINHNLKITRVILSNGNSQVEFQKHYPRRCSWVLNKSTFRHFHLIQPRMIVGITKKLEQTC